VIFPRPTSVARAAALPLAIALAFLTPDAAALAGCGGGDELSGAADVPDGYSLYRGDGVSFVHPDGFEPEAKTNANGIAEVRLTAPGGGDAYIHLTIAPDRGSDIEPLARSVRVAAEGLYGAEPGEEREVDVAGATAARRLDIVQPARDGAPRVERRDLLVLAPDGRFFILDAGGAGIDRDAVVDSFRLAGSE
jgi:hypothetical protein